jgi:hypothetical protein
MHQLLSLRKTLSRALIGALFAATSLTAFSQPVAWQHTVDYTSFPKITRDPSGNIYLVTREAIFGGRQLRVQKINPLGTLIWSSVIERRFGDIDLQYNIREAIYAHDAVYVLYHERAGGGSGTFNFSYARRVNPADGTSVQSSSSGSIELEGIAAYNQGLAYVGSIAGNARLFKSGTEGGNLANVTMPGFSRADDIVCQPDGTCFIAASRSNGTVSIIRVNPDDSFTSFDFDIATRTSEQMTQLVLDTTANRVYGFGSGYFNGIQTDLDVTVYGVNTDGTIPNSAGFGGSLVEEPGAISVVPGGGVVVSHFSDSSTPDSTVVRRLNSSVSQMWSSSIVDAIGGYRRSHAFDADGNLLVLDTAPNGLSGLVRVTKKAISTGTTLLTTLHQLTAPVTLDLLSDPAGNYYCTVNDSVSSHLFRLQPASMDFSTNTLPGGGLVTATINLASMALGDQTWTLASANAGAASVPASATVPNGTTSTTFEITTYPVTANTNIGISARYQGFIIQKTLTLLTPTVSALSISPNVVIGGVNTAGLVTISGKAPAGGKTVNLASSNIAAATVPASVVIPAGSTSFGFGVTTFGVTANRGVVITATTGAISKTAFFAVNAPSLVSVGMSPSTVKGGLQTAMTVTLDGVAPTGGRSVVIFSGAPGIVFAPASVTVPAGALFVTQNLNTAAVTSTTNVLIFATRSGIYKTTTLTVTP